MDSFFIQERLFMRNRPAAVFLDRDGTLIEDVGVLRVPRDIHLFPDTIDSLLRLQQNYRLFVVTNQSGISSGALTIEEVDAVHKKLDSVLSDSGITIEHWYVCPHGREDNCSCMKPKHGFLLQAAEKYRIDLNKSFIIGDHPHDVLTGKALGVFGLYVLTGHGRKHLNELHTDNLIFHKLGEAASWIQAHPEPETNLSRTVKHGGDILRRGGLVVFPTETVYGIGADAMNPDAVRRIFTVKNRPLHDPLIVHVAEKNQLEILADTVTDTARVLIDRFWPGPLTLVLPKTAAVPDIVTAGNKTVAVRMPGHKLALDVIRQAGTPVAAPSANLFGRTSPTNAEHVRRQLNGMYDLLIDGGACRVGLESTVLSLTGTVPKILRPGGITRDELEAAIGKVLSPEDSPQKSFESPGLLSSHYAPRTPLFIHSKIPDQYLDDDKIGFLMFHPFQDPPAGPVEVLSHQGELKEAAMNLYAAIRKLDGMNLKMIISHPFPGRDIGEAINDRLRKAAHGGIRE